MSDNGAIDPDAVAKAERTVLSGADERRARKILESLCDPTRLKILRALSETTLAASDLARVVGRSRAATSQHLRVMRDAGAVSATRSGNVVRYRVSNSVSGEILSEAAIAFDRVAAA